MAAHRREKLFSLPHGEDAVVSLFGEELAES